VDDVELLKDKLEDERSGLEQAKGVDKSTILSTLSQFARLANMSSKTNDHYYLVIFFIIKNIDIH